MEALIQLIKNTPEILRAASANDLALAAFFFLLGSGVIAYLMKDSSPRWKFATIGVWLLACLIALLLVLGPPPSSMSYTLRLEGQEAVARGTVFDLDLGAIEADSDQSVVLEVSTQIRKQDYTITGVEAPLAAAWAGGGSVSSLSSAIAGRIALSLTTAPGEKIVRQLRLEPASMRRVPALVLRVSFQALPATRTVTAASGPRSSGNGQNFSSIYTVCAQAPTEGNYLLESSRVWLTGDRSCGNYSHCESRRDSDGKAACLDFSLQGHNECGGLFSNCASVRDSEGHVEAVFRLRSRAPILTAAAT